MILNVVSAEHTPIQKNQTKRQKRQAVVHHSLRIANRIVAYLLLILC